MMWWAQLKIDSTSIAHYERLVYVTMGAVGVWIIVVKLILGNSPVLSSIL
jgi:hypothetical protein